jgi:hypothetical protein
MPILTDYSQLAISCAAVFPDDMKKGKDTKKMQDIIRHVTLKSLITYKRNNQKIYGDLILACDTDSSWRKKRFQYYKAHRAKDREKSDLDWDSIRSFIDDLRQDLDEVFPYKVVGYPSAEGDDVIAILTKHLQTAECESDNPFDQMMAEPPSILIVSSDHDFMQLHKFKKVKQWSPMQKKFVRSENPDFLVEKIITGDKGDGVPSVLMPDDFLVNGTARATPVTQAIKEKYKAYQSLTAEEKVRYDRNRLMIDFDMIPDNITQGVLLCYNKEKKKTNRQAIFDYLVKNRCRELIDRLEEF